MWVASNPSGILSGAATLPPAVEFARTYRPSGRFSMRTQKFR